MREAEITFYDYWRIVNKHRLIVLVSVVCFLVATWIFTKLQVPVYQAISQIEIKETPSTASAVDVLGIRGGGGGIPLSDPMERAIRLIKSEPVMNRLAQKMLGDKIDNQININQFASVIQKKINIERQGYTTFLNIAVVSDNKKEVAQIANVLADVYIEYTEEEANKSKNSVLEELRATLKENETKLKESENALREFKEKGVAVGTSSVLASRLLTLESQLSDYEKKGYTDKYPAVIKIKDEITQLRSNIREISEKEMELLSFQREYTINNDNYILVKKKLGETEMASADKVEIVKLIALAKEPLRPIRPDFKMNMGLGAFLGLLVGGIIAFVLEHLDTSIDTIEDVESFLQLSVLGVIPHAEVDIKDSSLFRKMTPGKFDKMMEWHKYLLLYYEGSKSHIAESYHALRTNISFATKGKEKKTIMFTSAGPREGKTLTIANYALATAAAGIKTVLIESDLRRPMINKIFGLPRHPGLTDILINHMPWEQAAKGTTDLLMGNIAIDKVLHAQGIENLRIITCGSVNVNPVDMMGSSEMENLIKELKNHFDLVLFDCPPLLLFADGLILSNKVDGIVMVYRIGQTARGALRRAKTQLDNIKSPILGVVINGLKTSEMETRYGYYYSKYRYSEKEER